MKEHRLVKYSVATLIVLGVGSFTLGAAANAAAPGDALYNLDQTLEDLQRVVTFSDDAKLDLELEILEERNEELGELQDQDDLDLVEEALDTTEEQQSRLKDQIGEYEGANNDATQAKEQAQVQLEAQLKEMAQLQEQYQEKGNNGAAEKVEKSITRVKDTYEDAYSNGNGNK